MYKLRKFNNSLESMYNAMINGGDIDLCINDLTSLLLKSCDYMYKQSKPKNKINSSKAWLIKNVSI